MFRMRSGIEKSTNLGAFYQSEKKKEKEKDKEKKKKMKKEEEVGKKITIGVCVMEKKVKCGYEVLFSVLVAIPQHAPVQLYCFFVPPLIFFPLLFDENLGLFSSNGADS